MFISSCMKREVVSSPSSTTIEQAALILVEQHIGTLPVVDTDGRLVGLLTLRDLLSLVMPDFVRLVEDFDFVHDFGAIEKRQPSNQVMQHPISEVMKPPVAVEENSGLMRAFSILLSHHLADLPVVDSQQKLIGIASRVDVGTALLKAWHSKPEG